MTREQAEATAKKIIDHANDGYNRQAESGYPPYAVTAWDDRIGWSEYLQKMIAEVLSGPLDSKDMPAADQIVQYGGGTFGPAMFHYAAEGCDTKAIARDAGFEICHALLEHDWDAIEVQEAYESICEDLPGAPSVEEILERWKPEPPEGWKLVGKHDTEDGPVAVFLRPIRDEKDHG